jgi:hypothetical protein
MERFVSPKPLPTPYERELLTILIEEAAEVQQRATKLLRFGRDEVQPGQDLSNKDRLSIELGDFAAICQRAQVAGLIDRAVAENQIPVKDSKLDKFLQTEKA